jgi:hypothetical protein
MLEISPAMSVRIVIVISLTGDKPPTAEPRTLTVLPAA